MKYFAQTAVLFIALTMPHVLQAEVKPNSLFSDNAVLQRNIEVPVWGMARDGERITVEFAGQKASAVTKDGKWRVRLKPLQAGGPFAMTIIGENTLTLTNILVGDVWVAGGQSNMEEPLKGFSWAEPVDDALAEIANANHPLLRQFHVPQSIAYKPASDANGKWAVCSPQTAPDFSAVGYFFGRDLLGKTKVPVGILYSTWGGTVAEAWASPNSLRKMPDFAADLATLHQWAADDGSMDKYQKSLDEWYRQNDPASTAMPAWSEPVFDTSQWKQMNLPTQWETAGLPDYDGAVWFRKEISLPESWAGKDAVLHLGAIDDHDTTWVNGVRVGAMHKYNDVRDYSVPASVLKTGRNVIVVRVLDTGGPGGIDGAPGQMRLDIPADHQLAPVSLVGAWQYLESVPLSKTKPVPTNPTGNQNMPTALYNAMLAPLQSFPIKGVIWYQGEANNDRAKQYQTLFPLLIADWRKQWQQGTFPFLFVQIAPYRDMRPEIREAQFLTLKKSPNTAMAVTTDAGNPNDIHPSHKKIVGERLALAALSIAYGEKIEYSGPLFDSMRIENNQAILAFTHVGTGLVARGGGLKGFTVCGEDRKFVPAHAEIHGKQIIVTSDRVARPVAVRYGWANVPDVNLYNQEGLPASPFRTDLNPIATPQTITIDSHQGGKIFEGVGAISGGGGNSRLLIDYREPYRSQILDYLFKPGYGARLQILKVEIGADMDSTDGAESSHMHTATDENYDRGYEWWLMEQARLRNPNIKLEGLPWGAPGWIGGGTNYWSQDMISYVIKWLKHAESDHHLTIDYVGGRNENGWDIQWYKELKAALQANGLSSIKIVGSDDWESNRVWAVATDMKKDSGLYDAIDVVAAHGPGWGVYPARDAASIGKPLWDGESHFDSKLPYNEVARILNRNYIKGGLVATTFWAIINAMYDNLPFGNVGFIKCNQPWSGHYVIAPSLWAMAHTAQFTQPGWQYIDNACGFVDGDESGAHGSFVTLKSSDQSDYSIIIETVDASAPQTVRFSISGFSPNLLHVWMTNLKSQNSDDWFIQQPDMALARGKISLTLQPGCIYSVTTTTGQGKGGAVSPPPSPLKPPYADSFDSYSAGKLARYFSDMYGAFETSTCAGGRAGICLRQMSTAEAICWKPTAGRPFTMMGDLNWKNYCVSCDVLWEQAGSVDLIGRLTSMNYKDMPNSYLLRVSVDGTWSIIKAASGAWDAAKNADIPLASGKIGAFGVNTWHHLALDCNANTLTAQIDGATVGTASDSSYDHGMAGLGVVGYLNVEFDNFKVDPLK